MVVAWPRAADFPRRFLLREESMTMRLLVTGACALFLVGCTAKVENPATPGNSVPSAVATDAKATFEIGRPL
jgi:hypothetical protein